MTHLHMREFSGTTFGMEAQSPTALRTLKKKVYYGEITPKGWSRPVKRRCVEAKYVAAVMGQAARLVTEKGLRETECGGD